MELNFTLAVGAQGLFQVSVLAQLLVLGSDL
jgi:hypothetical protein